MGKGHSRNILLSCLEHWFAKLSVFVGDPGIRCLTDSSSKVQGNSESNLAGQFLQWSSHMYVHMKQCGRITVFCQNSGYFEKTVFYTHSIFGSDGLHPSVFINYGQVLTWKLAKLQGPFWERKIICKFQCKLLVIEFSRRSKRLSCGDHRGTRLASITFESPLIVSVPH